MPRAIATAQPLAAPGRVCYTGGRKRKEAAAVRESATKKVIAESLKRRMLRHNLTDITVTDLCTDAEINRRTFYRHFTDKYQLVT